MLVIIASTYVFLYGKLSFALWPIMIWLFLSRKQDLALLKSTGNSHSRSGSNPATQELIQKVKSKFNALFLLVSLLLLYLYFNLAQPILSTTPGNPIPQNESLGPSASVQPRDGTESIPITKSNQPQNIKNRGVGMIGVFFSKRLNKNKQYRSKLDNIVREQQINSRSPTQMRYGNTGTVFSGVGIRMGVYENKNHAISRFQKIARIYSEPVFLLQDTTVRPEQFFVILGKFESFAQANNFRRKDQIVRSVRRYESMQILSKTELHAEQRRSV